MKYNETLNLPKTDFPMRGNLPQLEPVILRKWEEMDIYAQVSKAGNGKKKFILHDGPPYANGNIHLGTTFNKILKDMIVKYRTAIGYDAPYVPGWDTHGLPIEQQAIKALGLKRHGSNQVEFRQKCREFALKYLDVQRTQFKRMGVRADWSNPYITLDQKYEAVQIGVFGEMAKKGYIYKGLKPVYWCPTCETALAEAEIEYAEKKSASIYVKFPVIQANGLLAQDNTYFVIWTTTPWTLPANMAVCLHPDLQYDLIVIKDERYVIANDLLESFLQVMGSPEYHIEEKYQGTDLEGIVCKHPLFERNSVVILGEHVTTEQGTGCVHNAPGHGIEDFEVGKKYGLEVLSPVNDRGQFTEDAGKFTGLFIDDANKVITADLQEKGLLVSMGFIKHQFPHCWRCKKPVMFRATEQWFASIDGFREEALEAIENVRWIPSWGRDRIHNMVADRGDWCISRQRTWGVPIPIFYCEDCNQEIINDDTIAHIQELFAEYGSDIWWAKSTAELIPSGLKCSRCGGENFRREMDIMDVWFDSGSSHFAVLEKRPELSWPADLYLEGSDQHRGWFNSSLSTSVAVKGVAPYKSVLTHGFLVDEQGRKMSKSLGNGIDPLDVAEKMGADILRLWSSSADYRNDVAVSPNILKQVTESYRKIRNTCRYLLSNLYDYDQNKDSVKYENLLEIDKWALLKLQRLIDRVTDAYENYEFHVVYHAIHNFCAVDMSSIYLDIIKDRIYTAKADSSARRSAQQVMYEIIHALARMLTPILAYTTEEIWQYLPHDAQELSVQLAGWPLSKKIYLDTELENKWEKILTIRELVAKPLEKARQEKLIGHPLDAQVQIFASAQKYEFLKQLEKEWPTIFIVSSVLVKDVKYAPDGVYATEDDPEVKVYISKAPGDKCERCWMYSETTGENHEHPTLCARCATVLCE